MIYGMRKLGKSRVFPVVPSARFTYTSNVFFPGMVPATILNSIASPDDVVGSGGIITILSPARRLFQDPAASLAPPKAVVAGTDLFGFD